MNNQILLLELKRMRHKVKLASAEGDPTIIEGEEDVEVIDESEAAPAISSKPLNWTGPEYDPEEWESEPATKVSINPAKARERVERYLRATDPAELAKLNEAELDSLMESMTEEEVQAMKDKLDKYHFSESEAARGMVPGTGGMMTEEARKSGLERLRMDKPELFDPKKQKEMKDYSQSYYVYYDPFSSDERKTKFSEMMLASRGYAPVKLDPELADQLSGLIGDHLVGKSFTISTGSPTLPREETVKILDVDTNDQKIIFQPIPRGVRLFSSYDDFFYTTNGRKDGKSDGERALLAADPKIMLPPKAKESPKDEGALSRGWKNLLRILPPWAKA